MRFRIDVPGGSDRVRRRAKTWHISDLRLDVQGYFSGDQVAGSAFTALSPANMYSTGFVVPTSWRVVRLEPSVSPTKEVDRGRSLGSCRPYCVR